MSEVRGNETLLAGLENALMLNHLSRPSSRGTLFADDWVKVARSKPGKRPPVQARLRAVAPVSMGGIARNATQPAEIQATSGFGGRLNQVAHNLLGRAIAPGV